MTYTYKTCVLDIVRHLPRSTLSDRQLDFILWGMRTLHIPQIPSDSVIKGAAICLQQACGIRSIRYEGSLGHVYYVNDLLQIIAQVSAYFIFYDAILSV